MSEAACIFGIFGFIAALVLTIISIVVLSNDPTRSDKRLMLILWCIWAVFFGPFSLRIWVEALVS